MSDFDPYHQWLGIPETERPISKYRLLALDNFEDNRDVISAAAEQRTIYLRTLQSGKHEVLVAQLLNEVSQARVCLLDGKSKSRYDTQLRSDLEPAPEQDPLAFAAEELAAVVSKPATRSRPRSGGGKPFWKERWAIPAAAGGIVVLLLLMWLFGSGEEPSKSGLGQEKELQAEIAALKEKLVAAGNSKVDPAAREGVDKTSGPLELAAQAATARAAAERAITETVLTVSGHTGWVSSVAFSPDGMWIVSGSWDKTAKVWDAEIGQLAFELKGHSAAVWSVSFSPDGTQIVSGGADGTVKVWDAASGQLALTLKGHSGIARSVTFSPDGRQIVVGDGISEDRPGEIKVWDAETGQRTLTLKGHSGPVTGVAFSPDGKRIVSSSWDKTVKVWDVETGQLSLTLKGHSSVARSVAFSPDGTQIVSGGADGTGKVWDAASGQLASTLQGYAGSVRNVAFSPDGRLIVGGHGISDDLPGEIKVWDAETGQEALVLKGHKGTVLSVAFSPDGKRIVSGGVDMTLRVWDLGTAENTSSSTAKSLPASLQEGLVAYYPFNGNANDESGNGHDGIVRGASLTTDRFGTDNSAYSFDGTDDWIELGNVVSRYDVITMSAWVKPVDLGDDRPRGVIGKPRQSGGGGANLGWRFEKFYAGFNNHPVNVSASGENSYTNGEWHLATHVNDGSTVSLYVDGILAAEAPYVSGEATSDQIMSIGKELLVDPNDGSGLRWFHGDIDDIRIYNRALSAAEVKALYEFEKP